MGKRIETVTGPIEVQELGVTVCHEHAVSCDWAARMAVPGWMEEDVVVREASRDMELLKGIGVRTFVDCSTHSLGRDIHLLQKIAERTGLQIIASTGYFLEEGWLIRDVSEETMVDYMVSDITKGIQGTDRKAGLIKCATGPAGFTPTNEKILTACGKAGALTGVPVTTHCVHDRKQGLRQQDLLEAAGMDLSRVVIGHIGDSSDADYIEAVIQRGSYAGLDRFGQEKYNSLENRVRVTAELCRRGLADHLLLGLDHSGYVANEKSCKKTFPPLEKGAWHFGYMEQVAIPALLEAGVTREELHLMYVENPKKLFG